MTGALSPTHWAIILVVLLLVFGGKRLPGAARGLGRSLRIFKAETASLTRDGSTESSDDAATAETPTPDPVDSSAGHPLPAGNDATVAGPAASHAAHRSP